MTKENSIGLGLWYKVVWNAVYKKIRYIKQITLIFKVHCLFSFAVAFKGSYCLLLSFLFRVS